MITNPIILLNAIVILIFFIIIQVQTIYETFMKKRMSETIGLVVSLIIFIISLFIIVLNICGYNQFAIIQIIVKILTVFYIISDIYMFFDMIIKKKNFIGLFLTTVLIIEQIFIIITLNGGC